MSYEMKGNVIELYDVQQVTASFKKQEFVLQTQDGAYTQDVKFQCLQDKTELLNDIKIGDEVTVFFNINGKGWSKNGEPLRYFNNLNAWRIEKENTDTPQSNSGFGEPVVVKKSQNNFSNDLPF